MARVGEEGEAVRGQPADQLDDEDRDRQPEHGEQPCAFARAGLWMCGTTAVYGPARSCPSTGVASAQVTLTLTYISRTLYIRTVHAFDVLGDPVRRRILELLADGELPSGAISAVVQAEFGISQPAVSQHLKVLRESGFATVRPEGTRRLYAVDAAPFRELDDWLDHFRRFWDQRLDSLATELARGKRERRLACRRHRQPKGEQTR